MLEIQNENLKKIVESLFEYLLQLQYDEKSFRSYKLSYKLLEQYMNEKEKQEYTPIVGEEFIEYQRTEKICTYNLMKRMKLSIRRLNEFIRGEDYKAHVKYPKRECPPQFAAIFNQYIDSLRKRGLNEKSIIYKQQYGCLKILFEFDSAGIRSFSDVEPHDIYKAFESVFSKNIVFAVRNLFKYAFKERITERDMSLFVPLIRRKQAVPSVYTKDETEKLLACINRETLMGKRDYAIVLLALRLGIRIGDISNLKIDNIDFQGKKINFVQQKTHVFQSLELLPEIEDAVIAYISDGRQKIDIPNLFLTTTTPVGSMITSAQHIARKYFRESGINIGERRHGAHSLRSTLASELVSEKVPYDAVRRILGHEHPDSAKNYVKFDIEALRSCAVKVPALSGRLEEFMERETEEYDEI